MKKYVKKLLSILTALTLLIGVALPAGALPTFAAATEEDPKVIEILFKTDTDAQNPKYGFGEHKSADYASGYRVKFDYYLPENATIEWDYTASTTGMNVVTGDTSFKQGHHTMDFTCTTLRSDGSLFPRIIMNARNTDLYIWNWEISCNGVKVEGGSDPNSNVYVSATSTKTLSQYDWSAYMDTPLVTEIPFETDTDAQDIKYGFGRYYSDDHASGYRVKFDYYLPESATLSWENPGQSGASTYTGDTSFKQGHHTMDFTCISTRPNGDYYPRLVMSAKTTDLYIWNFEISCNGVALSKKENDSSSNVYVTASSTKVLGAYDWSEYMDTPLVTEIQFETDQPNDYDKYGFGHHYSADYASGYRVKFDYYLPKKATITWESNTTTGMSGVITGDTSFKTGLHSMEFTCISSRSDNKFLPRIQMSAATTNLYIWNFEISCNGVVLEKTQADNANLYISATSTTFLGAYDWSKYIKINASEMTMSGDGKVHLFRDTTVQTNRDTANGWTLSFDYYLPKEAAISVAVSNAGNTTSAALPDATTGSSLLQPGTHTFSSSFQIDTLALGYGTLEPVLYAYYADGYSEPVPDVYVWNWNLVSGNGYEFTITDTANFAGDAATGGYVEMVSYSRAQDEMVAVVDADEAIEIDFSQANYYTDTTSTNRLPYAGIMTWHGSMAKPQVTFSFDYYLPDNSPTTQAFIGYYYTDTGAYAVAGTSQLSVGFNTLTMTATPGETRRVFVGIRQGNSSNASTFVSGSGTKLVIWNVTCHLASNLTNVAFTGDDLIAGMEWFTQDGTGVVITPDAVIPENAYHFDFDNEAIDKSWAASVSSITNKLYIRQQVTKMGVTSSNYTNTFEYSFEYYMPEQSPIYVCHGNTFTTILPDKDTGTGYLQQGHHTYSFTFTPDDYNDTNTFIGFATYYNPIADNEDGERDYQYNGKTLLPGDLYVWNVKMKDLSTGTVSESYGTLPTSGHGIACGYVNEDVALDSRTFEDKSDVYEIDFKTADALTYGQPYSYIHLKQTIGASSSIAENEYTISFDYFLPESDAIVRAFFDGSVFTNADGGNGLRNIAKGENNDYRFEPGRHTFKAVVTGDMFSNTGAQDIYLRFELNYGTESKLSKLYVWNVQFYCSKGTETVRGNLVEGMPMVGANYTTATMTSVPDKNLDTTVELDMSGASIRKDNALRFVAAIKGASITRDDDSGEAQYDDTATITLDGVTYTVADAGILYGRNPVIAKKLDTAAPEYALTLGNLGKGAVYQIPAKKLQKASVAALYLNGESGVVFTGVIPNIPHAYWNETLSARAYVTVKGEGDSTVTFYGEVISRCLSEVNIATQPTNLNPNEKLQSTTEMKNKADEWMSNFSSTADTEIPSGATVIKVSDRDVNAKYKTLDALNDANISGTAGNPVYVLFDRGGEYRGQLEVKSNTVYGSYTSEGNTSTAKPVINGSRMNYADETALEAAGLYWQQCDAKFGNRWQLVGSGTYFSKLDSSDTDVGNNVGNMYFFDEEGTMLAYGSKSMTSDIYQDYKFYHHYNERVITDGRVTSLTLGDLFVYLPEGMTPESFGKIEIATKMSAIVGASTSEYASDQLINVTIDNLSVKYTGNHGISFTSRYKQRPATNVTVTNCEIGWIGGSIMRYDRGTESDYTDDYDVRLGNGIELYGNIDGANVSNNWIYQCYDAGYSNQGAGQIAQNIVVEGNLIEYCAYSIEVWMNATTGLIEDCDYVGNIMRFAGYEFERDNRIGGEPTAISHVNFMHGTNPCHNVTISDNVFDTSYVSMIVMGYPNPASTEKNTANDSQDLGFTATYNGVDPVDFDADLIGATISGNTWVQTYDHYSRVAYLWKNDANVPDEYLEATSQDVMTESVAQIDREYVKANFYY